MPEQQICPCFDTCVIGAILKTIEVPQVLRYCAGNHHNCRYLPRTFREGPSAERRETAAV